MHGFLGYRGCARRSHSGHFGGFGAPFGHGVGLGGRGFFRGRKLGSGELQLVILALLEERPRHGYEIIKALEETSKGFYAPSPGMVYPALTYLEEVGYATVEAEGSKKLYRITDAGLARLNEDRALAEAVLAQLARIGGKMDRVRQAFAGDEQGDVGHRQAQCVSFSRGTATGIGGVEASDRRASARQAMTISAGSVSRIENAAR